VHVCMYICMYLDDISDMMAAAGLKLVHRKTMNFGSVGLYVGEKAA
jgi:hypothetical protein